MMISEPQKPEPKKRSSSTKLGWAVAILFSAVFLYLAFKGVNWQDLLHRIAQADRRLVVAAMALVTAGLYLRARRWRVLLNAKGTADPRSTFWATALGYLGNYVLPARAGEVLRSIAIARQTGISQSYVFATALSERLFDAAVLVLFASVALAVMPHLPTWLWSAVRVLGVGAVIGIVFLLLLPRCGGIVTAVINRTKLNPEAKAKLIAVSSQFLLGSGALVNTRRAFRFVLYTLLIWAVESAGAMTTARCLNLNFSFVVALILVVGIALASAVPSTPGSLGISQFVATSILGFFAIGKDSALAMILLWQGIIYIVMIFWGTLGAWQLRQPSKAIDRKPVIREPVQDLA